MFSPSTCHFRTLSLKSLVGLQASMSSPKLAISGGFRNLEILGVRG